MKCATLILFDIDGTLLLTGGAGKVAFEAAFEGLFGVKEAWSNIHPDGKTDPDIFQEAARRAMGRELSRKELLGLRMSYTRRFVPALERSSRFRVMPGAARLVRELALVRTVGLGVATGNYEAVAWHKLKKAGLERYFDFGGFGSDDRCRTRIVRRAYQRGVRHLKKQKTAKHKLDRVIVIGDTPRDVAAAKENGFEVIAVATGSYGVAELRRSGADRAVADLTRLSPADLLK